MQDIKTLCRIIENGIDCAIIFYDKVVKSLYI